MDFLDKIVLHQSSDHIQLLHYLLILIQFLFIPFISAALVGTFLSLSCWKNGIKKNNEMYLRFSKDLIETLTSNKSLGVVLGILPVVTSFLIYAQLLQKSNSLALSLMFFAVPLIIFGIILIYVYRYSISFRGLFSNIKSASTLEKPIRDEISKYESGSNNLANKTGAAGLIILLIGMWFYITSISYAVFSESWTKTSLFSVLFSVHGILNFFQFLLIAFAITGSIILFAFFYWEGGKENLTNEYREFVKRISISMTLTSLILFPIILLITTFILPHTSLTGAVFGYSLIALVLIFVAYHILYAIYRTSNLKMSGQLFVVVIFAVLALVIKDQLAMSSSTKLHSAELNSDFQKYLSELKGEGASAIKIRSGEEIYQVVCSACHKFDEKLVGPPYNKVLVKYEGKIDQLVAFIRNPVKVDPEYPPMPNQGLRADEAKNIANYIMDMHLKSEEKK